MRRSNYIIPVNPGNMSEQGSYVKELLSRAAKSFRWPPQ